MVTLIRRGQGIQNNGIIRRGGVIGKPMLPELLPIERLDPQSILIAIPAISDCDKKIFIAPHRLQERHIFPQKNRRYCLDSFHHFLINKNRNDS